MLEIRRGAIWLLVALIGWCASACRVGGPVGPSSAHRDCGTCHRAITAQYRASAHAGVDCAACHEEGGAQVGPYRTWGPHGMRADPARLAAPALCGACHEAEHAEHTTLYAASRDGEEPRTCVSCHMPASFSRLTQGGLLPLLHPRRVVRDHGFDPAAPARREAPLELATFRATPGAPGAPSLQVTLGLVNRGAGHRLPTGAPGHRPLRLEITVLGADGGVLGRDEKVLNAGGTGEGEGFAPGRKRTLVLVVELMEGRAPVAVRLVVARVREDGSPIRTLLDLSRSVEP